MHLGKRLVGMPRHSEPFRLRPRDRTQLQGMLHHGVQHMRVVLRVLALLHLDRGALAQRWRVRWT